MCSKQFALSLFVYYVLHYTTYSTTPFHLRSYYHLAYLHPPDPTMDLDPHPSGPTMDLDPHPSGPTMDLDPHPSGPTMDLDPHLLVLL